MSNTGNIVQVIGPVVDVQFAENAIPPIYQALTVEYTVSGKKEILTLEIQQGPASPAPSPCPRPRDSNAVWK
jgi:F-type H+-transporting ATPase subunit beta